MSTPRTCSVADCEKVVDARDLCSSHYARLKRYGAPLGKPVRTVRVCDVDACERPARSWGYCNMHAQRYYHHGDPEANFRRERSECSAAECTTPQKGHGYCEKHLRRLKSNGDVSVVRQGGRPTLRDNPGWAAVHKRVRRDKGAAERLICIDCGSPAQEWSYDNADPAELRDERLNIAYSLSIDHYEPRCIKCHRAFDAAHRRARSDPHPFRPDHIDQVVNERLTHD